MKFIRKEKTNKIQQTDKRNIKVRNLLRFVSFCIVFCLLFGLFSSFLTATNIQDTMHIKGFYKEPDDTIDVILIGASEVYTGFNSPLAFKEFGFTSYSLSYGGVRGKQYESMLKSALEHQTPKIVVFDVGGFSYSDEDMESPTSVTLWFDNEPWSKVKYEEINRAVPKSMHKDLFFGMDSYHSNWRHLGFCYENFIGKVKLNVTNICYTKSFATTTTRRGEKSMQEYKYNFSANSEKYLRSLLECCKDNKIENVLFLRSPHCLINTDQTNLEKIKSIVTEYGYDFENYDNSFDEIGLNPTKDFYNEEHLNIIGAQKYTSFLGKYFVEHYGIVGNHQEKDIEQWNICVDKMDTIVAQAEKDISDGVEKTYYEISAY